jgi:hypothetical protein
MRWIQKGLYEISEIDGKMLQQENQIRWWVFDSKTDQRLLGIQNTKM